jgi:PPM family protein phosphatase
MIEEASRFSLDERLEVEILAALGQLTQSVYYFKVKVTDLAEDGLPQELGLLRVGSIEGGLKRELDLRETLQQSKTKVIADLLAKPLRAEVRINLAQRDPAATDVRLPADTPELERFIISDSDENHCPDLAEPEVLAEVDCSQELTAEADVEVSDIETIYSEAGDSDPLKSDYLEDEYYPSTQSFNLDSPIEQIILLTVFPDQSNTLQTRLAQAGSEALSFSLEDSLLLVGQICQFFQYVYQQGWCFVHLLPSMIQIGKPTQFYDLTSAYPTGAVPSTGLMGDFYAPELALGRYPVSELMSSYAIGSLLYQLIYRQVPPTEQTVDLAIDRPIPRIYQLLKICLSPVPEERFRLEQLRDLLLTTRKLTRQSKIDWETASRSTIGLSVHRLQNEDSYGIRQQQVSNTGALILAVVADGMGGLAQGEVASQLAVQTLLEEPLPHSFETSEQRTNWLVSLFQKANDAITQAVREGGTTLSVVLAVSKDLLLAHVGDSRIYLLRQGAIRQLSEDHSLVAMLVSSGQITEQESLTHPDRNVLTKSMGSQSSLIPGYVQVNSEELELENGDRLLLCSDGVWDLVQPDELQEIFSRAESLQGAVDETIDRVLQRGASDNATLLALQFCCDEGGSY